MLNTLKNMRYSEMSQLIFDIRGYPDPIPCILFEINGYEYAIIDLDRGGPFGFYLLQGGEDKPTWAEQLCVGTFFGVLDFARRYKIGEDIHEDKLDLRNSKMKEIPLERAQNLMKHQEWLNEKVSLNTDEDQGGHEREAEGLYFNTSFGALAQPDSCPCPSDIKPVKLEYDADKAHTDKSHG